MQTANYLQQELDELVKTEPAILDFLQNVSLDGLWFRDLQVPGQEWTNLKFWRTLGYAPDQIPAEPGACRRRIHPEDLAAARQHLDASLRDPARPYNQVVRYTHRNGSTVWMRCYGLILRDAAGTPTRLLGALIDITKEKSEGADAQKLASQYDLLLDNQSVYIIRTDPLGNYTYVNDLFYERFGADDHLIGTSSMLSILEEDRPKCIEVSLKCLQEPEVPHHVILRKIHRDSHNNFKSNHWEFKGILGEQGEVVEILCVGYDITQLVENLQKSQHLLDVTSQQNMRLQNFAYIISHNIRSHSANLTSLVQLLAEAEDKTQSDMFLQMLKTSTDKLAETIVNLSDIITVNSNLNKPKEPRPLRDEINKTLEALSVLIRQHNITLEVDVPPQVTVNVVPAYLESILLNLISNAVKYRSPSRPSVIRLQTQGEESGFVVLSVQDNGLGIDLVKNRAKLFGMYKTFHNNEDARGVGLFITKNQIEAMLGKITVESEVGVGSTFKVYFNENA